MLIYVILSKATMTKRFFLYFSHVYKTYTYKQKGEESHNEEEKEELTRMAQTALNEGSQVVQS